MATTFHKASRSFSLGAHQQIIDAYVKSYGLSPLEKTLNFERLNGEALECFGANPLTLKNMVSWGQLLSKYMTSRGLS